MGYESIAHEAEGRMGYDSEAFSKIQLVGQKKTKTKHLSQVEARLQSSFTAKTLQIWWPFDKAEKEKGEAHVDWSHVGRLVIAIEL